MGAMARVVGRIPEWPAALVVMAALAGPFLFAHLYNSDIFSDEPIYFEAGKQYIQNIREGNFRADDYVSNREHPAISKYLFGLAGLIGGEKPYLAEEIYPAKVLSGCVAILTGLLTFLAGRDMFGRRVGWLAGCVCVLMPQVLAHGRVAGLDGLTLFFFTLATWLFYRGVRADLGGKAENVYYLFATLATTVAMSTRLNSVLLLPQFLTIYAAVKLYLLVKRRELRLSHFLHMIVWLPPVFFLAHFPWFWHDTLEHLAETFGHWSYHPQEWYLGSWQYPTSALYYVWYFLGTTTEASLLMLALLPVLWLAHRLVFRAAAASVQPISCNVWQVAFVLVWLVAPFGWSLSHFRQDGVRYILQIYAPLSILTALAVVMVEDLLHRYRPVLSRGVVSISLVVSAIIYAAIYFPYYLDFFNIFVGGPRGVFASRAFEMSWWGEGGAAAIRKINDPNVCPPGSSIDFHTGVSDIWRFHSVRRDLVLDRGKGPPDFILRSGKSVYPVNRDGTICLCMSKEEWTGEETHESIWEEPLLRGVPLFRLCRRKGGLSPPHRPKKLLTPADVDDSLYIGVCIVDDCLDKVQVDGRKVETHLLGSLYEKQACQLRQFVCRLRLDSEIVFTCRDLGGSGSLSAAFYHVRGGRWHQVPDPHRWKGAAPAAKDGNDLWIPATRCPSFRPLRRMAMEELHELPLSAFGESVWVRGKMTKLRMKLKWPIDPDVIE